MNRLSKSTGFTLIELVTVIVLLGILSVGISGFLKIGSEMFVDVKNRSEIVATARFAMERLNRELRSALPNSANELENNTLSVIEFNLNGLVLDGTSDVRVVVYPIKSADIYDTSSNKTWLLENATLDESQAVGNSKQWDINFSNNVLFEADSPTRRLYFIDNKVSYCVRRTELKRFVGNNPLDEANPATFFNNNGVLMATDLLFDTASGEYPFRISEATQSRNSMALIKLIFSRNDEFVVFNNEVHIPNAP